MNGLLWIDRNNLLARAEAGIVGVDLEQQVRSHTFVALLSPFYTSSNAYGVSNNIQTSTEIRSQQFYHGQKWLLLWFFGDFTQTLTPKFPTLIDPTLRFLPSDVIALLVCRMLLM